MVSALRSTLIIWSDAMYEASRGALGFVAFDPDDDQYYYSAYVVPSWVYLFFRALQTYIGQLEILAVLFAYLTLPKRVVCNRPVLHYIDNTMQLHGWRHKRLLVEERFGVSTDDPALALCNAQHCPLVRVRGLQGQLF